VASCRTLLRGVPEKTIDALGQVIPDEVHSGRLRFRSGADVVDPGEDDFCLARLAETTAALALAARCSAGFPGAFEPSFVPVDCQDARGAAHTQQRPDLGRYASWRDAADEGRADRSRFVVDGGVLVNTPTRPALEAIDAMPVEQPSRRLLLLVHPHAPVARPDRADLLGEPPLFTQGTAGLLGPLTAQGSRNFVRHRCAQPAGGRTARRPVGGAETLRNSEGTRRAGVERVAVLPRGSAAPDGAGPCRRRARGAAVQYRPGVRRDRGRASHLGRATRRPALPAFAGPGRV
jgi:hypothetical protein